MVCQPAKCMRHTQTQLLLFWLDVRGPTWWQRVGNPWVCPCSNCGPGCFLTSVAQTVERLMWQLVCDESCKYLQRLPGSAVLRGLLHTAGLPWLALKVKVSL